MRRPRTAVYVAAAPISVAALIGAGCASMSPTHVGQTAGAIAGSVIAPGIGAPLGSLVGLLTGLVFEQGIDKQRERTERTELTKELATAPQHTASAAPTGTPTRVWVDERVENGRLITGHFEVRAIP